jgi:hypothetical protein
VDGNGKAARLSPGSEVGHAIRHDDEAIALMPAAPF